MHRCTGRGAAPPPRLLGRLGQSGNICFTVRQNWLIIKINRRILGDRNTCYIIVEKILSSPPPPNIKVIINCNTFQKIFVVTPPPPPPDIYTVTLAPLQKDMASICLWKRQLGKDIFLHKY